MSTSQDKKAKSRAERDEKRRQEERADRRAIALYSTVGVVVVLAAILMMVWTSGILQRNLTAVEVNGTKYTAVDVEYYYSSAYSTESNQYVSVYGTYPFDPNTSLKKQTYDAESGQSWYDHLMEVAMDNLVSDAALVAKAQEEGYTLSQEAQEQLDTFFQELETVWYSYGYQNRDTFIRTNYGSYMTYDRLVKLMNQRVLASDYADAQVDAIEHGDADYQAYYQEHANELDTLTYDLFVLQAQVATQDEEGNTIEMTEAESAAALEEQKTAQQALAQEIQAKLEAGEDAEALAEEYQDQVYSSTPNRSLVGSNLTNATYGEWLLDSSRTAGDTTIAEYDSGSAYYYYVVRFQDRTLDETPTADVRHILVAAEQDEGADEPTQEQYDAAYTKAEELLEQWKSGEATEDSFAQLATENSADSGSASDGGLITNVSTSSGYVDTFTNWALDPSRKAGDTGIVQNTGSSTKGWHIMYYVSSGDPIWRQTVTSALRTQDLEALEEQLTEGWNFTTGIGMNFISG